MDDAVMVSLAEVFAQIPDPRDPRGVRHPARAILALAFLGLTARIREMTVLVRWAQAHWDQLREPLGFERDEVPHATTISRTLARCSLAEFSRAFARWVRQVALDETPIAAAVDGKTSRQGLDADGQPVQILTMFAQQLKLVLGQWSVRGEKTNEPGVLKQHVEQLVRDFPMLRLITGDAIFCQRPLAEAFVKCDCNYLLQVKANQPDMLDALKQCLGSADERPAAVETVEKRGGVPIAAGCGLRWTTPITSANSWAFPAAALPCASIAI